MNGWKGGRDLMSLHSTFWVSDGTTLAGAGTAALREKVRAMREAGEIPEGVRDDVFLVVDEAVLRNSQFVRGVPISVSQPLSEVLRLRGVDPDHDPTKAVPTDGPEEGFAGEIEVPLPRVFDWLFYTFFAGSESWRRRYVQTNARESHVQGAEPKRRIPWRTKIILPYPRYDL